MDPVFKNIHIDEVMAKQTTPLALAYIGDCVYELYVRLFFVTKGYIKPNTVHKKTTGYVNARSQARILESLLDMLDEEEKDIVRRGRNAHSLTIPKNADIMDYKYATGFETLIGYLYLMGREQRLAEILNKCINFDFSSNT